MTCWIVHERVYGRFFEWNMGEGVCCVCSMGGVIFWGVVSGALDNDVG